MINEIEIKNILSKDENIIDIIKTTLYRSRELRSDVKKDPFKRTHIKDILTDEYNFNMLYGLTGLMRYISHNKKLWLHLDEILSKYVDDFYMDQEYAINIIKIKQLVSDRSDYSIFFEKMIEKFQMRGLNKNIKKVSETLKNINIYDDRILNKLQSSNSINIQKSSFDDKLGKYFDISENSLKIVLTNKNYVHLMECVNNPNTRKKITNIYNKKLDNIFNDLGKTVVLRYIYAKEIGFDTYFGSVSQYKIEDTHMLNELINGLSEHIDSSTQMELEKLGSSLPEINKKLNMCDIIHYYEESKSNTMFNPMKIIGIIFSIIKKFFHIKFTVDGGNKLYNGSILYLCTDDQDNTLGYLSLDISRSRQKKSMKDPVFIKLTDKFMINNNKKTLSYVTIVANYEDVNKNCISFDDIILLFKEFGHVVQRLTYESNIGLVNYDIPFGNFFPQLMTHILWDTNTIQQICDTVHQNETKAMLEKDHIIYSNGINFYTKLKLTYIGALFDHIIHNSVEFIQILQKQIKTNAGVDHVFNKLYRDIFIKIMGSSMQYIDQDITIPSHLIASIVDGNQGIVYGSILNDLFAYSVYEILKSGKTLLFYNEILKNSTQQFRELLNKFIKSCDIESYDIYLRNNLNINVEYTDKMSELNYFDDKETDMSESDIGNIIIVKK